MPTGPGREEMDVREKFRLTFVQSRFRRVKGDNSELLQSCYKSSKPLAKSGPFC